MSLLKFNLFLFLVLTFSIHAVELSECLQPNYSTSVSHQTGPFGLLKRIITVDKRGCVFDIGHQSYFYLKKRWLVDVCRAPVHIKYGNSGLEVFKWNECPAEDNQFCESLKDLVNIIQDDGLIFAEGDKENLQSDHGKLYCTFRLVSNYLVKKEVFSRGFDYKDVLKDDSVKREEEQPVSEVKKREAPVPEVSY